jgi:hypothetical protein
MLAAKTWTRVTKQKPCPICGKPDHCGYGETVVHCMRVPSEWPDKNGMGWFHRRGEQVLAEPFAKKSAPAKSDAQYAALWEPALRQRFINQVESIGRLAAILGVAHDALDMLRVGYDERERSWWFGERNAAGRYIGVNRRFEDGKKLCAVGSKRGLTYVDDWQDWPGPCYLVEGASDVAAGLTIGICVVGRPSNIGGAEYLALLLKEFQRPIVVLGERDKKRHEDLAEIMQRGHDEECLGCQRCWPGLRGMEVIAAGLRKQLKREIGMAFPADGSKDVRTWLNRQEAGSDLLEAWQQAMR